MFNKILSSISTVSTSLTNNGAPSTFKFLINEKVETPGVSLFDLHNGKPKHGIINIPGITVPVSEIGALDVSVFVFKKSAANPNLTTFAQNAMRKLVSIRHPSVLRVLDSAENENGIYLATEHVVPITIIPRFKELPVHGLYQLVKGIQFIHEEVKLVHGSLDPANVFVTDNGGFRLAGFELARPKMDTNYTYEKHSLGAGFFKRLDCRDVNDVDLFGFVLIVHYLANGPATPPGVSDGASSLTGLVDAVIRGANKGEVRQILEEIIRNRKISTKLDFFQKSQVIEILEFLDSVHVRGDEAIKFLESLPNRLNSLSRDFQQGVMLDMLQSSVLSISSLVPSAVPVLVAIGSNMTSESFRQRLQPTIITLFSVQDRSVRFRLLGGLAQLAPLFDPKSLESGILVECLSGFTDSHPSIREQTLRGVIEIGLRISPSAVEKRVIPHLVKLLKDPEASIRTNAIVAIAKIAPRLELPDRQIEILGVAILAGLRDSFGPAKLVGLETLDAVPLETESDAKTIAVNYLPLVCVLLADSDPQVSTHATQVVERVLVILKRFAPKVTKQQPSAASLKMPDLVFPSTYSAPPAPIVASTLTSGVSPYASASSHSIPTSGPFASTDAFAAMAPSFPSGMTATRTPSIPAPAAPVPWQPPGKKTTMKDSDFDSFWDDVAPAKPSWPNDSNSLI